MVPGLFWAHDLRPSGIPSSSMRGKDFGLILVTSKSCFLPRHFAKTGAQMQALKIFL